MKNTRITADDFKFYADIYDLIGDYKTADEFTGYIVRISEFQDQNIRLAGNWGLFEPLARPFKAIEKYVIRPVVDFVKHIAHETDKLVRKYVPGGWVTVILIASGSGLLGAQARAAVQGVVGQEGWLAKWSNGTPVQKAIAKTLTDTAIRQIIEKGGPAAVSEIQNLMTATMPRQSAESIFLDYRNKVYNDLRSEADQTKRQKKLDGYKQTLPKDIEKQIPEYKNVVQDLIKDIVNRVNAEYPSAKIQ